jgi:putative FmdB family regulatory protein
MPKYIFECPVCEVRFERNLKVGDHPTHECPECQDQAPLVVSGFGFAFAEKEGAAANSGVHDQDYPTADKAVGRSAQRRWDYIESRNKVKEEARKQGETHALIRHTGDDFVEYEPMSDEGRKARKKLEKEAIRVTSEDEKR